MAVVETDSTVTSSHVWIGRCLKADGDEIVIPFKEVGQDVFIFLVGGGRKRIPLKHIVSSMTSLTK